jgi:hypothetical protein
MWKSHAIDASYDNNVQSIIERVQYLQVLTMYLSVKALSIFIRLWDECTFLGRITTLSMHRVRSILSTKKLHCVRIIKRSNRTKAVPIACAPLHRCPTYSLQLANSHAQNKMRTHGYIVYMPLDKCALSQEARGICCLHVNLEECCFLHILAKLLLVPWRCWRGKSDEVALPTCKTYGMTHEMMPSHGPAILPCYMHILYCRVPSTPLSPWRPELCHL